MTRARTARCACGTCTARTLHTALKHIERGRPAIAAGILQSLLLDLPPRWLRCDSAVNPYVRQLEQQLIEYQGWTRSYQAQERARIARGEACPCLARAGQ